MKKCLCLLMFLSLSQICAAQYLDSIRITTDYKNHNLIDVFNDLQQKYSIDIFYKDQWVDTIIVKESSYGATLNNFLQQNLNNSSINFTEYGSNIILLLTKEATFKKNLSTGQDLVVIGKPTSNQREIVEISGVVKDGVNSEPLIGALVEIKSLKAGAITNMDGRYSLKVPTGIYTIDVSFIGYDKKSFDVSIKSGGVFDAEIFSGTMQLKELVITADGADFNVQNRVSGVEKMGIEAIKQLPTFLGEIDPVKSLTTLPGVSAPAEASSGFNVRGGDSGENLILQDGAVIYNPSHLFGFFSAFNPDLVNNVTLHKGGGPAKYGGRTSSVLNIDLRNGDVEDFKLSGGVGIVSSRLTAEGPIIKNTTSFIVGVRASYSNWLLKEVDDINIYNSSAQFYDINAKIFHRISDRDQISASFYHSDDSFKFASDTTFSWATKNYSVEWNHVFNDQLLGNMIFAHSNYQSNVVDDLGTDQFKYSNSIDNYSLRYDTRYSISSSHAVEVGIEGSLVKLNPGKISPLQEVSNISSEQINPQQSFEGAIYVDDELDLSKKVALTIGLRYSMFYRLGPDQVYFFSADEEGDSYVSDSISYSSNEVIKSFGGLEPRASIRYLLSPTSSIKASFYRTRQYLHLISNTVSVTPQDYWISSGPNLEPQVGNQFSLGIFKNLKNNSYELSAEGFYKTSKNVVDYKEGADIFLNKELENDLIQGEGMAYGIELFVKKNSGQFSGWIAYTYSRSLRKFYSDNEQLSVNNGVYYPSNFDKPHDLSIVINYDFAPRLKFSANFSYSTGRPVTVPVSKFNYDKILSVLNYSDRNEYRIPDYHRLDISLTLKPSLRKNKLIEGEWVFSVFNVYGRENAYSVFFDQDGLAYKMSILGTVFPSLSYNFKI